MSPINTSGPEAEKILNDYEEKKELFGGLNSTCTRLLEDLLKDENIGYHSVTGRVKDRDKLREKLTRHGKNYGTLENITDIVGIRIITHFESEIDKVGLLIEKEFTVDQMNSVDKRKNLAPDRFGYLSVHYICSLPPERLKFRENKRFENLKFEIQIRSILQHAWAEIEHDLGYKSAQEVPSPIRRRFSRIAGLLEIADQEFAAIRSELKEYASNVDLEVRAAPANVGIDNISLRAICDRNPFVREIDDQIAQGIAVTITDENASILPILSKGLPSIGINTVEHLIEALKKHRELLVFEATARLKNNEFANLNRGACLLQLLWVLMGLRGGVERILSGIAEIGLEINLQSQEFAREVVRRIQEFQRRSLP